MKGLHLALAAGIGLWSAGTGFLLVREFAPQATMFGFGTGAAPKTSSHSVGSLGDRRYQFLVEASRRYRAQDGEVPGAVAQGTEFAPVTFLNQELKREGKKWRVRSVDGLEASVYEVS